MAETQRLLATLRRLGYGPSWVAERLGVYPATVGLSPEQAVDDAIARIKQILKE